MPLFTLCERRCQSNRTILGESPLPACNSPQAPSVATDVSSISPWLSGQALQMWFQFPSQQYRFCGVTEICIPLSWREALL